MTDEVFSIVVVGELNPYGKDPKMALYHLPRRASGDRLRQHLGLRDVTYARLPKRNLCLGEWSAEAAHAAAMQILGQTRVNGVVVVLGTKARKAFQCDDIPFFRWKSLDSFRANIVCLPHPSGRNHLWNNPAAPAAARKALKFVAPYVPWGETDSPPSELKDEERP